MGSIGYAGGRGAVLSRFIERGRALWARRPDHPTIVVDSALIDALTRCGFDVQVYINSYDDLKNFLKRPEHGYSNFANFASEETRWFPIDLRVEGLEDIMRLPISSEHKARIITALLRSYLVPWSGLWLKSEPEFTEYWTRLINVLSREFHPYFIIGDSHTQIYTRVFKYRGKFTIPFQMVCLATSARGLISPTSRSGAGGRVSKLAAALQTGIPRTSTFLKFGQVDVEFVFDFHRVKNKKASFDVEEWRSYMSETIDRYLEFISSAFTPERTFLLGIFPPALSNEALARGYVNDHIVETEGINTIADTKAFIATLQYPDKHVRTNLYREFNAKLFRRAKGRGFVCLDEFDDLLDETGVVALKFIPNHEGADHHLGYAATRPVAETNIKRGFRRFAEIA